MSTRGWAVAGLLVLCCAASLSAGASAAGGVRFDPAACAVTIELDGVALTGVTPGVMVAGELVTPNEGWQARRVDEATVVFERPARWEITQRFAPAEENDAWFQVSTSVRNLTDAPIAIDAVIPLKTDQIASEAPLDRFLSEGPLTWNYSGMWAKPVSRTSHAFAGFSEQRGAAALLVGFDDLSAAECVVDVEMGERGLASLVAKCDREGVTLGPGETLRPADLVLGSGESLTALLKAYGWIVTKNMGRRTTAAPAGWCSWYYYYGGLDYEDLQANMAAIHACGLQDKLRLMQIDAGWYEQEEDGKRAYYLDDGGYKFPMGMKAVASAIKQRGFMPGIWLAPFLCRPGAYLLEQHPSYFVQGPKGPTGGMDLTHPGARDYVRKAFAKLAERDGYEYFKIDFLGAALFDGRRHDANQTSVECFRSGMRLIRRTIGEERFMLACGAPLFHCVGIVDGARVGHDISTGWIKEDAVSEINRFGVVGVKPAANQVIWRQWMNQIFWHNDPDCIITRDYQNPHKEDQHGLTDVEAGLWARLTWFTGGMAVVSENLLELKQRAPERFKLMADAIPTNPVSPDVVDWYVDPLVTVMKSPGAPPMFGVFNLSDEPAKVEIPRDKLGLPPSWTFTEKLTGETFAGSGARVTFPNVPAHGGRIWVLASPPAADG